MDRQSFFKILLGLSGGFALPNKIAFSAVGNKEGQGNKEFLHPGILHTKQDLERMRHLVEKKASFPFGSFEILKSLKTALSDYKILGPFSYIARDGVHAATKTPVENDFNAAYRNALMWVITGDETHAKKAVEILNAYAHTLKYITGWNDNALAASLNGFILVNAAEIMRYSYDRWDKNDIEQCKNMFREVFCAGLMDGFFYRPAYTNGNWGAAAIKAMMGFGVFLDDREIYQKGVDLFYSKGKDNGSIYDYIINDTGQCQESGRDQQHAQLGIGCLAEACEVGWHQGMDMYGALDNRLLRGYEYTAKYNLGFEVPYIQWKDITGKYARWREISAKGRGTFRPIFEIACNHYVNRRGLKMPMSEQVLSGIRPEGTPPYTDHPGFGSLLFKL